MNNMFYSRGKLLLTGEYFVMEGAQALAVPLKVGQHLKVGNNNNLKPEISWETHIDNKLWFVATFDSSSLNIVDANDLKVADYLQKLLNFIKCKSDILTDNSEVQIRTDMEFFPEWGLGSSSSLISNLAYWSNINPYKLFFSVSEGSGYDIACARSDRPILYQWNQEPVVSSVSFQPDFLNKIFLVYLGKKQDSLKSVLKNRSSIKNKKEEMARISELTALVIKSKTLDEFEAYIQEHETIIAKSIDEQTVKSKYFSDFQGTLKSLGAWGGDFILATHSGTPDYVKNYFNKKGLDVIFPYNELVL